MNCGGKVYLAPPLDKTNSTYYPHLPTGVDQHSTNEPPSLANSTTTTSEGRSPNTNPTPLDRGVHINKSPTTNASTTHTPPTSTNQSSTQPSQPAPNLCTPNSNGPREIHDHSQMLLCVFKEDSKKEKCYHVEDFAGLCPVWLIIKFSIAPSGASKDKRMYSFSKS